MDKFEAVNEPVREYLAGSEDRDRLEKRLAYYSNTCTDVPIVIGDEHFFTDDVRYQVMVSKAREAKIYSLMFDTGVHT